MRQVVGHRIHVLRVKKKWSQEKLAEETGLSKNSIGDIEHARKSATIDSLEKIVNALDTTIQDLFNLAEYIGKIENPDILIELIDKLVDRPIEDQRAFLEILDILLGRLDRKK
jgi:XRE family transcriptional regulator, regulator of sulfur utilization